MYLTKITFFEQALVGNEHSQQFHVFELTRQLPRFSMYAVLEHYLFKATPIPAGEIISLFSKYNY